MSLIFSISIYNYCVIDVAVMVKEVNNDKMTTEIQKITKTQEGRIK